MNYDQLKVRFLSVDPLTKSYPYYTPYQFAGNKPIIAIDLDGLEEKIVIKNTYKAAPTQFYNQNGELQSTPNYFSITEEFHRGDHRYDQYANNAKYGQTGTLHIFSVEGGSSEMNYEPMKRSFINKAINESVAPFVHVGSSIIMPLIKEASTMLNEGVHEGPAYNESSAPKWAVPYKLDDGYNFIPIEYMENMDYEQAREEGGDLMNSTAKSIIGISPIKPTGNFFIDQAISKAVKIPLKAGVDAATPNSF